MTYTIERITLKNITPEIVDFVAEAAVDLRAKYGNKFPGWRKDSIFRFAEREYMIICRRDKKIVGFIIARLLRNVLDPDVIMLYLTLLYGLPGTRAANLLVKEFIDFGKANANHIITAIAYTTNIKPRSLMRLGFEEMETLYRLETKK